MAAHCPRCGQRVLMRCGVQLTPKLVEIFDLVARRPKRGVMPEALIGVLYPGEPNDRAYERLKANVWQLNSRLLETDYRVRGARDAPYRLVVQK